MYHQSDNVEASLQGDECSEEFTEISPFTISKTVTILDTVPVKACYSYLRRASKLEDSSNENVEESEKILADDVFTVESQLVEADFNQ